MKDDLAPVETNLTWYWVSGVAALLATARVYIGMNFPPEPFSWVDAYKDLAHLFVGGLLVSAINGRGYWPTFWALCIVEVGVAVLSRQ